MKDIIIRIIELLNDSDMTAKELTEELGLNKSTVNHWKNGTAKPSVETIVLISRIFDVSLEWLLRGKGPKSLAIVSSISDNSFFNEEIPGITSLEISLLENFRILPESEKLRTLGNIEGKAEIYSKANAEIHSAPKKQKEVPILSKNSEKSKKGTKLKEMLVNYGSPVAAGTGHTLQEEDFEKVSFPEMEVPINADFGVYIVGDSMEPEYFDGEIAWVRAAIYTNIGEVGIYSINGDAFIKQHGEDGLVSFNKKYPIIKIINEDDFRTFGKVVGKTAHHFK